MFNCWNYKIDLKIPCLIIFVLVFCSKCSEFALADNKKAIISKASWYSKDDPTDPWRHTTTASGEAFDENALTCARRSHHFGHYFKVTNLRNGKSVIVKHTDFGPAKKFKGRLLKREIDLSKAAFAKIADLDIGVIPVKIEAL